MSPPRRRILDWVAGLMLSTGSIMSAAAEDACAVQRRQMVDDIARIARETQDETGRAVLSARVMAAMAKVPRHRFVPADEAGNAYRDRPLSIGSGQTISQPFIVALMTDFMEVQPADRVLEIGSGSGYQTAVLAELAETVCTVEIVEPLGREAAARLEALGYRNVLAKIGDGHQGWAEHAPFDAIMVTAAASAVPPALVAQLKPGGRMVIPVGAQPGAQTLYLIEKQQDGKVTQRALLAVRFVPLTREQQNQNR